MIFFDALVRLSAILRISRVPPSYPVGYDPEGSQIFHFLNSDQLPLLKVCKRKEMEITCSLGNLTQSSWMICFRGKARCSSTIPLASLRIVIRIHFHSLTSESSYDLLVSQRLPSPSIVERFHRQRFAPLLTALQLPPNPCLFQKHRWSLASQEEIHLSHLIWLCDWRRQSWSRCVTFDFVTFEVVMSNDFDAASFCHIWSILQWKNYTFDLLFSLMIY